MTDERCRVQGCARPTEHFPIVQFALPLSVSLVAELMQAISQACERRGLQAVIVDLPDHFDSWIYARTVP